MKLLILLIIIDTTLTFHYYSTSFLTNINKHIFKSGRNKLILYDSCEYSIKDTIHLNKE